MTAPPDATTDDLTEVTTPTRTGDGRFSLEVALGWEQGRGAFGGLVLGSLARAIEACEPDAQRALRSLSGEITGPVVTGEAAIAVEAIRIGNGVSTWRATLTQRGEMLASATAVLGRTRITDRDHTPAPPDLARGWTDTPVTPAGPPIAPNFVRYMELRALGPPPFSGGDTKEAAGWVRARRAAATLGAPEVVALADAWWPAALAAESAPRPIGTVGFTLQYFPPATPLAADRPLYHRAYTAAARDGFVVEFRELWTEHGALVAMNQQTIVWIR